MDLRWKLYSSRTIGHIRIVRWAARVEGTFLFKECAYEMGHDGLLADEEEATKRLLQTRYGLREEACLSMTLEDLLPSVVTVSPSNRTPSNAEVPC